MTHEITHAKKNNWVHIFTVVQAVFLGLFIIDAFLGSHGVFSNSGAGMILAVYFFAFAGPLLSIIGLMIGNFLWLAKKEPNRNLVFMSVINIVVVFVVMIMGLTYN